ncbi:MAG: putative two-component system protein hydrogenase maturation factor HypX/HoxX [Thermoleophilaceae bacterium]|nr:putative two-component system protein hydrogenase maturation factor HypX/HoxX [Thermoleophilaceae bacterium]
MLRRMETRVRLDEVLRRSANPLRGEAPAKTAGKSLRILFLVSAHNSLSQRAYIALSELGHQIEVAVVDSGDAMEAAVAQHQPDLIVCPMLKKIIPESIWARHRCLVVHPGPRGDRGPSSLDWAIELGFGEWGLTILQATEEVDAGDIWATRTFPVRPAGKSSLYRHEVRRAAVDALVEAIAHVMDEEFSPQPLDYDEPLVTGRLRPLMKQSDRAIDWLCDGTATVIRGIRAAEGHPGVLDTIHGIEFYLFGVHPERTLRGRPGEIIATRHGAICRATVDGAVWITHLKRRDGDEGKFFKLPATGALAAAKVELDVPELPVPVHAPIPAGETYREIWYEEHAGVGYLNFDFYNGAMSTDQSRRLREAYLYARGRRQTKVIVLGGGADFFSNGIHLNVIEAAENDAEESWYNLHAIDDLVREIVETDSHLVISALAGDAAAGGVPLALAADHVVAREDVVLNPYYKHMGGLYGSEYWTYLLPRRVGAELSTQLTESFKPVGTARAVEIGLLDAAFGDTVASFRSQLQGLAERLARHPDVGHWLEEKRIGRQRDEQVKPLSVYRTEELAKCHECFFGLDRRYHEARNRFVYKLGAPCAVSTAPPVLSRDAAFNILAGLGGSQ